MLTPSFPSRFFISPVDSPALEKTRSGDYPLSGGRVRRVKKDRSYSDYSPANGRNEKGTDSPSAGALGAASIELSFYRTPRPRQDKERELLPLGRAREARGFKLILTPLPSSGGPEGRRTSIWVGRWSSRGAALLDRSITWNPWNRRTVFAGLLQPGTNVLGFTLPDPTYRSGGTWLSPPRLSLPSRFRDSAKLL